MKKIYEVADYVDEMGYVNHTDICYQGEDLEKAEQAYWEISERNKIDSRNMSYHCKDKYISELRVYETEDDVEDDEIYDYGYSIIKEQIVTYATEHDHVVEDDE